MKWIKIKDDLGYTREGYVTEWTLGDYPNGDTRLFFSDKRLTVYIQTKRGGKIKTQECCVGFADCHQLMAWAHRAILRYALIPNRLRDD